MASGVLSQLARELMAFFHGRRSAFINIGGEIGQMNATLGFLTRLDPHDRQSDITAKRLTEKFFNREVPKKKSLQT